MPCTTTNCDDEVPYDVEWYTTERGTYPAVFFPAETCPNGHALPDDSVRERYEREIYEGALDD